MTLTRREATTQDWTGAVSAAMADGYDCLDFMTAVDRPGPLSGAAIEIVLSLERLSDRGIVLLAARVPYENLTIPSVTDRLPAVAWHEREIHEMFGVHFAGHDNLRPLMLIGLDVVHPMRKDAPLARRIDTPWPGAKQTAQQARRAAVPLGVPTDARRERP